MPLFELDSASRERREEYAKRFRSGSAWGRLEEGETVLRIYPFSHTITEFDFKIFRAKEKRHKAGQTIFDWCIEKAAHFNSDTKTSEGCLKMLGLACSICDEVAELNSGTAQDKALARNMQARPRYPVNAVNVKARGTRHIEVYELPKSVFEVIDGDIQNPQLGSRILGDQGCDFRIIRDDSRRPNPYTVSRVDREFSTQGLDFQGQVKDLWTIVSLMPGYGTEEWARLQRACPYQQESDAPRSSSPEKTQVQRRVSTLPPPVTMTSKPQSEPFQDDSEGETSSPSPVPDTPSSPQAGGKKRGRPKGSRNRPRTDETVAAPAAAPPQVAAPKVAVTPPVEKATTQAFEEGDVITFLQGEERVVGVVAPNSNFDEPPDTGCIYVAVETDDGEAYFCVNIVDAQVQAADV